MYLDHFCKVFSDYAHYRVQSCEDRNKWKIFQIMGLNWQLFFFCIKGHLYDFFFQGVTSDTKTVCRIYTWGHTRKVFDSVKGMFFGTSGFTGQIDLISQQLLILLCKISVHFGWLSDHLWRVPHFLHWTTFVCSFGPRLKLLCEINSYCGCYKAILLYDQL